MSVKSCMHCGSTAMRRINRKGFFEEKLLPSLGVFPWECAMCRRKTYLRSDGHADLKRRTKERRAERLHEEDPALERERQVVDSEETGSDEKSSRAR